jgi:hypothetical protein
MQRLFVIKRDLSYHHLALTGCVRCVFAVCSIYLVHRLNHIELGIYRFGPIRGWGISGLVLRGSVH